MTTLSFSKMFNNKFVKTPTEQNTPFTDKFIQDAIFVFMWGSLFLAKIPIRR